MAIQFNLLPWRNEQRINRERNNKRILIGSFSAALVVGLVWFLLQHFHNQDYRNALNLASKENQALLLQLKEKKQLTTLKKMLNQKITTIERLQENRAVIPSVMETLSTVDNQSIFFTQLEVKNKLITLTGIAASDKQISRLMTQLSHSHQFQEPKLIDIIALPQIDNQAKRFIIESRLSRSVTPTH